MRLLVVAWDASLARSAGEGLHAEGWRADAMPLGLAADAALRGARHAAAVFDVGTRIEPVRQAVRAARRDGVAMPLLVLAADASSPARIAWLDAGADELAPTPVVWPELSARLRALLRRSQAEVRPLTRGDLTLELETERAWRAGRPLALSRLELDLLHTLMLHPGKTLSRDVLALRLYGGRSDGSNVIEVHVHHLRRKVGAGVIETVRGAGYRFVNGAGSGRDL